MSHGDGDGRGGGAVSLSGGDADAALRCLKQTPLISVHGGLLPAIANTSLSGYFSPAVDGVELTAPPEVYAEAGKLNNVSSVMLGTNLNEGRFLMPLIAPVPNGPNATVEDVKSWILANYGDLVN